MQCIKAHDLKVNVIQCINLKQNVSTVFVHKFLTYIYLFVFYIYI